LIWPFEFRLIQGPYATQQRNFEELCALLIKSKHPRWKVIPRESPDLGVDFLAKSRNKIIAFQCKFFINNFGVTQLGQIAKSLDVAILRRTHVGWSEYVLCVPRNLTAQSRDNVIQIGKNRNIRLSILQGNDLWALLTEFPSVQHAFFPTGARDIISVDVQAANLILGLASINSEGLSTSTRRLPESLTALDNRSRGILLQTAGNLFSMLGDNDKALGYYQEAEQLLDFNLDKTDVLREISRIYLGAGQIDLGRKILRRAGQISPDEMRAAVKIDYGEYLLSQQEYKEAQNQINIGLKLARKYKRKAEIARGYTAKGDVCFYVGELITARKCYGLALGIWQQLGDNHRCAAILSYLGSILHRQGRLNEALERLTESVRIFESAGDLSALAEALTSMGMVLFEKAEWYSAAQCHHRCLQIENVLRNIRGQAICFNNLGLLMRVQGKYQEAFSYHQNALTLSKQINDKRGMVYSHSYLGLTYLAGGELRTARKHFSTARRLAKKIPFRFGEVLSYLNMAQVAIRDNKATSAIKMGLKGYEEITEIGGEIEKARAARILAEAYLMDGNADKAVHYAKKSSTQFRKIGAHYESALSLLVLSRVQVALNDVRASETKGRGEELLSKIGAVLA